MDQDYTSIYLRRNFLMERYSKTACYSFLCSCWPLSEAQYTTQKLIWVVLIKIFWYSRDFAERWKLFISLAFLFLLLLKMFVYQGYNFPLILSTQCVILWYHTWLLWQSLPHKLQKQKEPEETKSSYFHKYISENRIKRTVRKKPNCLYSGMVSIMILLFSFCKSPETANFLGIWHNFMLMRCSAFWIEEYIFSMCPSVPLNVLQLVILYHCLVSW